MSEERYRAMDLAFRAIGGLVAFAVIVTGIFQYREAKEREFKKSFFESRVALINEVFDVMLSADLATNDAERAAVAHRFRMIYTGTGRLYLDREMFKALDMPAEYIIGCVEKLRAPSSGVDCSWTANMTLSGFAIVARKQLSMSWDIDFEDLGKLDPWDATKK